MNSSDRPASPAGPLRSAVSTTIGAALLAFVLHLAFAPVGWAWLLVPALAVAIAGAGASGARRGWLLGTAFVFGELLWVIVPAVAHLGIALAGVAAVLAALEALPFAVAGWAFAGAARAGSRAGFALGAPALYALVETARASGTFGLPLATLGTSQTSGPLAVLLALGGVPLTSFAALALAATLVLAVRDLRAERSRRVAARYGLVACAVAVLLGGANLWWARALVARPAAPLAVVGIVQAGPVNVGRSFAASARAYAEATRAVPGTVDFALWPEGVLYLIAPDAPAQRRAVAAAARGFGGTLLVGATLREGGLVDNDLVVAAADGTLRPIYTKRRLVPFGEYAPFGIGGAGRPTYAVGDTRDDVVRIRDGGPLGALICYEVAFSDLTRDSVNAGAGYLVAVLNDSWFAGSDGPAELAQLVAARAIESGVAIVRADTVPPSGVIDASGAWVGTPLRRDGVTVLPVPPGIGTPFRVAGPLPTLVLLTLLVGVTLPASFRRRERLVVSAK